MEENSCKENNFKEQALRSLTSPCVFSLLRTLRHSSDIFSLLLTSFHFSLRTSNVHRLPLVAPKRLLRLLECVGERLLVSYRDNLLRQSQTHRHVAFLVSDLRSLTVTSRATVRTVTIQTGKVFVVTRSLFPHYISKFYVVRGHTHP